MTAKILIINDSEVVRELTQFVLEEKGYTVISAKSGSEGLELAAQQKPDLILLDIIMPEMDGYETCEKLKASSNTNNIPVLFLSCLTNSKDKIKGLELGAVDFISNVADKGELIARVQTHLHIQSLTRSLMESNNELTRKQKILDDDLRAAAMIQQSFLAPTEVNTPSIQLVTAWLPAQLVGGDIFNMIQCGQKVVFYMLDVSGHDVTSALVTVSISQYLHQQNTSSSIVLSPKQMMLDLDREYPLERFNRYFTIAYLVLDIPSGVFSYCCAGHPPVILQPKGKNLQILDRGGPIIGFSRGLPFEEGTEVLKPGDKVILYTDGVTEMKNQHNEYFGTERLYELIETIKNEPVKQIVNTIETTLNIFRQDVVLQDDTSIMCLEFKGG